MTVNDEAAKLEVVMDLLKEIDEFPEHPQFFYHRLLDVAVRVINEATSGTVSLVSGGRWMHVASIGHDTEALLDLELDAEWDYTSETVQIVDRSDPGFLKGMPEAKRSTYLEILSGARYAMVCAYHIADGVKVVISVETDAVPKEGFEQVSQHLFESFVRLAGTYQRSVYTRENLARANNDLLRINEDLTRSYQQIDDLNRKLYRILGLTSELYNDDLDSSAFFENILQTALLVVDEAEYGSVSVVRNGRWEFVAAIGHDLAALQSLELKSRWAVIEKGTAIHQDIMGLSRRMMPARIFRKFNQATRPVSGTARMAARVAEDHWIILSVDIPAESNAFFSEQTRPIIDALSSLAQGFLRLRLYAENMNAAYLGFANKLALVAEAYDRDTAAHNNRVAMLSGILAAAVDLKPSQTQSIVQYAALHDIGKVLVDRSLLIKKEQLSGDEYASIQQHTRHGHLLLDDPWFRTAQIIAHWHHERWDGSGYPDGLRGNQIPIEAQIVGVADVYDALRSKRVYKQGMDARSVLFRMRNGDERLKPGNFNPVLLDALEENLERIEQEVYSTGLPARF